MLLHLPKSADGKSSRIHTSKILRLSGDLPLVIEIVDREEKINAFLPVLDTMMSGGLVTLEKARVIYYHTGTTKAPFTPGRTT